MCGSWEGSMDEWHHHVTTLHRLTPRWRNPRLQAGLKLCLAKELQRPSWKQGTRRCYVCARCYPSLNMYVHHLQGYHGVKVGKDFLSCLDGEAGAGWQGRVQQEVVVMNEEMVEEEELMQQEEQFIQKKGTVMQDDDELQEEEEEEDEELGNVLEDHEHKLGVEECRGVRGRQDHGQGGGGGGGGRWRCRVCALVFTSQHEHDVHKSVQHPRCVRVRQGRTQHTAHHTPPRAEASLNGTPCDPERPGAASQEDTTAILEGDGCEGITHHRLSPITPTEANTQQDTTPQLAEGSMFPCPACPEVFGDEVGLVQHQGAAHPRPGDTLVLVECPLCSRRLAGHTALHHHLVRVHRRPPHPPLRHQCHLCMWQCSTRTQLQGHMRDHHNAPRQVLCAHCGKIYAASYIDSHVANMHGDKANFHCTFCPMKFRARHSLYTHTSMEHTITSWTCQECPLKFPKYHQLRQHRLYMHSRVSHRCAECPISFKRRCDLTEHIKRRHKERPALHCSFCPKVYTTRTHLRLHLMSKHSVAWEDTLAKGYARNQRDNNCLKRRTTKHNQHHQQQQQQHQAPHSLHPPSSEKQQPPREEDDVGGGGDTMVGGEQQEEEQQQQQEQKYSVVQLSEAPHPLEDTISYIILEET